MKTYFPLETVDFHCHVSLLEGNQPFFADSFIKLKANIFEQTDGFNKNFWMMFFCRNFARNWDYLEGFFRERERA